MGTLHEAGEWLRLSEHYQRMTDGELIAIARAPAKLTDIAQQILAMELSARKLKVEPESQDPHPANPKLSGAPKSPTSDGGRESPSFSNGARTAAPQRPQDRDDVHRDMGASAYAGDPYEEDRKLVEICTVWSFPDALQLERILNTAGIPFFMGPEKAASVDSVTSNLPSGVSVKVMRVGMPWAERALQRYEPKDVPESEKQQCLEEADVRCPSCRSKDIVFEEMVETANDPTPKYKWTCSVCGHKWQDDGVATSD
jgi:DNA-directed RNA polymerase subunit M/transcription elongation factor TFIIS